MNSELIRETRNVLNRLMDWCAWMGGWEDPCWEEAGTLRDRLDNILDGPTPDVLVTVSGGVAEIGVFTPGIAVEVRDYDVDGLDADWQDEDGKRCFRYFEHGSKAEDQS